MAWKKMAESRIYSSIGNNVIYFSRAVRQGKECGLLNQVISFASFCRHSARRKFYHIEILDNEAFMFHRNHFVVSITGSRLLMRCKLVSRRKVWQEISIRDTVSSVRLPFLLDQDALAKCRARNSLKFSASCHH